mgnify:CR=1 FL=1
MLKDNTHRGATSPAQGHGQQVLAVSHACTLPRGTGPQLQEDPGLCAVTPGANSGSSLPGRWPWRTGFPRPRRAPVGPRSPHAADRARTTGPGCVPSGPPRPRGSQQQQGVVNDASLQGLCREGPAACGLACWHNTQRAVGCWPSLSSHGEGRAVLALSGALKLQVSSGLALRHQLLMCRTQVPGMRVL